MKISEGGAPARCAAALLLVLGLTGASWRLAEPGYTWSFPRDHWAHPSYASEWWYFTGHLQDVNDPRRRFGYQFTIFRVGLVPLQEESLPAPESRWQTRQLLMGHAAIGDLQAEKHYFSDLLYREMPLLAGFGDPGDPLIAWSRAPAGTDGKWTLHWNGEAFDMQMRDLERGMALDLRTRPLRPLVFQGPGGFSRKGDEAQAASLYYSFTRLETQGRLTLGDTTWEVSGSSWMDKEFSSSQLSPGQVGWDWMALQLADGRDLMLYLLRRADGSIDYRNATLIDANGRASYLAPDSWSVQIMERRRSPATGANYPSRWQVALPEHDLDLEVVPLFADQENVARRSVELHYWEGAVRVLHGDGRPAGRGYVELTGYGDGNRPPL